jgi:hypothetical protein
MTYMRSWKSHRLTSHTWLGLNPQIGRPLSRIVVPLVYLFYKPSEKDHVLPGTQTRDVWSSRQHTQPLHHLSRYKLLPPTITLT